MKVIGLNIMPYKYVIKHKHFFKYLIYSIIFKEIVNKLRIFKEFIS